MTELEIIEAVAAGRLTPDQGRDMTRQQNLYKLLKVVGLMLAFWALVAIVTLVIVRALR